MLRVGQMLIAQALTVVHLGHNWKWQLGCKNKDYRRILSMFQDNRTSLYSIHQISIFNQKTEFYFSTNGCF